MSTVKTTGRDELRGRFDRVVDCGDAKRNLERDEIIDDESDLPADSTAGRRTQARHPAKVAPAGPFSGDLPVTPSLLHFGEDVKRREGG